MLRAFQSASTARAAAKSIRKLPAFFVPRAKISLRALVRPAFSLLAMFLLMHAEVMNALSPFAPAFLAAALAAGWHPAPLCAGCMAGMLRLPLHASALSPASSCALVLLGELAVSFFRKSERSGETRCALLAGTATLLPGLFFAGGNIFPSLQAISAGAMAAASAPFFMFALKIESGRKQLMLQERTGIFLLAGAAIGGLQTLFAPLAGAAAVFAVLALWPMGAAVGVVCGLGRVLGGAGLDSIAAAALPGFVSGWNIYRSRWQRAACVAAVTLLVSQSSGPDPLSLAAAVLPCAAYALLPENFFAFATVLLPRRETVDPDRIAREIGGACKNRLIALADAFGDMAESCGTIEELPDEQALISEMRCRLCSGCAEYPACWNGADNQAVHFLCSLIGDALDRVDAPQGMRVIFSDGEIPPDVMRFCRRGRMIPDRLGLLLRDFAEKRRSVIKRSINNRSLAVQLLQAQDILRALAEKQVSPVKFHGQRLSQLNAALECAKIENCEAAAVELSQLEIRLTRKAGEWTGDEVQRAASAFSQAFGGGFAPHRRGRTLYFARKPRFEARTGVSCSAGMPGSVCGDSHLLRMLNPGQLAVMLSDGMGSGESAARESADTLRLLWRFMNAGIPRPLAIETVNQHMLLRTGDEIYATVDLCLIDLNTGVAEFSKLAACRSLILRGSEILRVEGGSLPLGILDKVRPEVQRLRLSPGDVILLASDGVMDACDAPSIERIARMHAAASPDIFAEEMVREAALHRSQHRSDDMTCICIRIEESKSRRKTAAR